MMKLEHKKIFWREIYDLQLESINGVEFTLREIDIIACILSGKTAKKIALFLSIAPKTVENHIRNIMLKLGCRAQENIIDFIERSSEFALIKKHYSMLLIHFFFEVELKKISSIANKENVACLVFYNKNNKESLPFIYNLNSQLNNAGLKIFVTDNKDEEPHDIKAELVNYVIYIHSSDISYHEEEKKEIINISNSFAMPIISILYNKNALRPTLSSNYFNNLPNTILIEQENYYFLIFETLKRLYKIDIEANISEFKNRYESLHKLNNQDLTCNEEDIYAIPQNKIKTPYNKKILAILALIFISIFPVYLFNANISSLIFSTIWRSHPPYELATKYIEMLEEEEEKLGKLVGDIEKLKFLRLKNDFAQASSRLLTLEPNDKTAAENLIVILKETFPIDQNNRRNEKIHKLFFAMASYHGKLAFIEGLLENRQISFLDFKDYYGNTSPMLAAAKNKVDTFEWLAKKDALFINHKNVEGNSALILAALNLQPDHTLSHNEKLSSIKTIKQIIEYDPDSIKARGHKECTALLIAGAKGNITAIQYFLDILAPGDKRKQLDILENQVNIDGNNILLIAAYNGRKNLIEWLHKNGINLKKKNKYNTSAFMQAASGGSVETMDLLLRLQGSSVLTEKNNFGQTAIFLATHGNRLNVFQWILERLKDNYFHNDEKKIADYIKSLRNADGDSLLHILINGMSVMEKPTDNTLNTGLLDILLNYINVNTHANNDLRKSSDTSLMRAAYYGNLTIVKYLIEKCGANVKEVNNNGETAIYFAAMGGQRQFQDVIEYLWEQQAVNENKNIQEIRKQTSSQLFLAAVRNGQNPVIKWFLKNNPELIESRTADDENVLSLAINNFHIDVIEFLFNWNKITAVRLTIEKRNSNSQNILERLIAEEKQGVDKNISLASYLGQKVGARTIRT